MLSRSKGFTLVEVVVVIAVVALLSAIIVPVVAKQVDEAKIGRAQNECTVIAASILQFYKDVGVIPGAASVSGVRTYNQLTTLVSGTAVATIDGSSTGMSYGYTQDDNDDWYDGGGADSVNLVDTFDNHLNTNTPEGDGGAGYVATGEFRWKGPYLARIGMDPWGHPYCCDITNFNVTGAGAKMCVVISAGPNGYFDTPYPPSITDTEPTGDDIWVRVGSIGY